ncbi:MAG TPA: hypothetical protein VD996_07625 [Chitinophagaceae bacterium]|nr:hypothetical protein [Chitinophagaceae bacterium]
MTRIVLILMLICCIAGQAVSQQPSPYLFERRYEGPIVDFTVDNLGNIYLVYKSDQIKKINANGDSVGVFNAVRKYGQLHSIDATNPLKLILYYKDFGTVLALDRFLNVRNTIDLRTLNIFQAKAVGLAYDGNVWVFDEQEGKLKKISEEGKIIDQTNDLRQLFDSLPSPDRLIDQGKLVYLYDSTKGLYMFDYYGALKNRVRLLNWKDVAVVEQAVFGRNRTHLLRYDAGTLNLQQIPMPQSWQQATRIHITSRRIYVLNNGLLEIYTLP